MLKFKLPHVSYTYPIPFLDDFWKLRDLQVDGIPVTIGYRGNLYEVSVIETAGFWDIDPSYRITPRYRITILNILDNKIAGEGTLVLSYGGGPLAYTMAQVAEETKKAIIRANVEPTDFYK